MDYELTDAHKLIRDTARRIAREKVAPRSAELDESGVYPEDIFQVFARGRPARPDDPREVRRLRRRLPRARPRRRGDRQARQRLLADPAALGALDAADQPRRLRGAEAGVALEVRHRRDQGRVLPDRAEHRLRRPGPRVARASRRRRLRDQRREDVHLRRQRRATTSATSRRPATTARASPPSSCRRNRPASPCRAATARWA